MTTHKVQNVKVWEADSCSSGGNVNNTKQGGAAVTNQDPKLLTAAEAADYLGLKVSTIRRLTYTRELPVVRPTGKRAVRYRLSELEALLRARSQAAREEVRQ